MRKKFVLVAAIAALAVLMLLPAAAQAFDLDHSFTYYKIVLKTPGTGDYGPDFTAIGNVAVAQHDENTLHVWFYAYPGYELLETAVAVAANVSGIPQNAGGPTPGQFPVHDEWSPPVNQARYDVDVSALGPLTPYIIVAHATVRRISDGTVETSWGTPCWYDCWNFPGKNWARWFPYPLNP